MDQSRSLFEDPSFWIAILSALGSCVAALFAWFSWTVAKNALKIEQGRELRQRPTLVPYLVDGFCKFVKGSRLFVFSVSLSNPSDVDNSVALIELRVDYTMKDGMFMSLKVPVTAKVADELGRGERKLLVPPLRIDAHQTISGLIFFEFNESLVRDSRIDAYTVLIQDAQGGVIKLEQTIVRELADETPEKRISV
jgi:hypothetical protein